MFSKRLTPDNTHLSRPIHAPVSHFGAINGFVPLSDAVLDLIKASLSSNTHRAYQADLNHFVAWGGAVPADPALIASYLANYADELAVATLARRVASLSKAHEANGLPNPCRAEIVRATLRGIRRTRGTGQQQAKPLLREDLILAIDRLATKTRDVRDRALLLLGFAGGFRRSELVGLDHADIKYVRQGLIVTLRRSKTDQEGGGRRIGVPYGRTRSCAVAALNAWTSASGTSAGPLFRPVNRHGHVQPDRLSGEAVSLIVRERVADVGIDPDGFSGHSLRAGFATSAAQAGLSTLKIRQQTGHASDAMLARYVRNGETFVGNPVAMLL